MQSIESAKKVALKPASKSAAKPKKTAEGAKKAVKKASEPAAPVAWFGAAREYVREVAYELRKVVWPSRKETIGTTAVVLVIVAISAVFLGIIDFFLSHIIRTLVG